MNNKQIILGVGTLAAVGLLGISAAASAAERGPWGANSQLDTETKTAIHEAMQNKDLEALKTLLPEKFGNLTAEELEQKIANRGEHGFWKMGKHHKEKFDQGNMEAVKAAIQANDYTSWKAAVGEDSKMSDIIENESDFAKLVKMHELHKEARAIAEELGLGGHKILVTSS